MATFKGVVTAAGRHVGSSTAASMSGCRMRLSMLVAPRVVVNVSGPDAKKMLQGMTTNDMNAVGSGAAATGQSGLMYASFLSAAGRSLFEGHVTVHPSAGDTYFVDVGPACAPAFLEHLKKFRLRSKVTFAVDESLAVVSVLPGPSATAERQQLSKLGVVWEDCRHSAMGWRAIVPRAAATGLAFASPDLYHTTRMMCGLPEGNEIAGLIPLEWNVDLINGVSYTKGCYLGQELVSRTHYNGLVRKRVVPVFFTTPLTAAVPFVDPAGVRAALGSVSAPTEPVAPDAPITAGDKKAGSVVAVSADGTFGLAMIRMRHLEKPLTVGTTASVVPVQPPFWSAVPALPAGDEAEE